MPAVRSYRAAATVLLLAVALAHLVHAASCPKRPAVRVEDDDVIRIGIPIALGDVTSTNSNAYYSKLMKVSFDLWADNQNRKQQVFLGKVYRFELVYQSCGSTSTADEPDANDQLDCYRVTRRLASYEFGRIDFLFATYSSVLTPYVAQAAEECQIPTVSGHAASEVVFRCDPENPTTPVGRCEDADKTDQRRWEYTIGVLQQAGNYLPGFLSLIKLKQARHVFIFMEDTVFTRSIAAGATDSVQELNLPILAEYVSGPRHQDDYLHDRLNMTKYGALLDLVDAMRSSEADVVVGGTYYELCQSVMIRLAEINYMPHAIAMTTCVGDQLISTIPQEVPYLFGPSGWDQRLKGRAYSENVDNALFHFPQVGEQTASEQFASQFFAHPTYLDFFGAPEPNATPTYQAAAAYVMGYAVTWALRHTTDNSTNFLPAFRSPYFEGSLYGPIVLDDAGHNYASEMLTHQVDIERGLAIVTPLSSATIDAIYPTPAFDERSMSQSFLRRSEELGFFVVTSGLISLSLVLGVMLYVWRDRPQIKTASLLFCEVIVFGGVLTYCALYFGTVDTTDFACNLYIWLLVIGMDLMLGALIIKNFRIFRIFKAAKNLRVHIISNKELFVTIAAVTAVDVLIIFVWEVAFPVTAVLQIPDPHRPALNYFICKSSSSLLSADMVEKVFISLLGAYKGFQILAGTFMAFSLRKTPSAFNEARFIGYALYNLVFALLLLVIIWTAIPQSEYRLAYILRSLVVAFGVTFAVLAVFTPKVYYILTKNDLPSLSSTSARSTPTIGGTVFASSTGASEDDFLVMENQKLREENAELKKRLQAYTGAVVPSSPSFGVGRDTGYFSPANDAGSGGALPGSLSAS